MTKLFTKTNIVLAAVAASLCILILLVALIYGATVMNVLLGITVLAAVVVVVFSTPALRAWLNEMATERLLRQAEFQSKILRQLQAGGLEGATIDECLAHGRALSGQVAKLTRERDDLAQFRTRVHEIILECNEHPTKAGPSLAADAPTATHRDWMKLLENWMLFPWQQANIEAVTRFVERDELARLREEVKTLTVNLFGKDGELLEGDAAKAENKHLRVVSGKHLEQARHHHEMASHAIGTPGKEVHTAFLYAMYVASLVLTKDGRLSQPSRNALGYVVRTFTYLTCGEIPDTSAEKFPAALKEEAFESASSPRWEDGRPPRRPERRDDKKASSSDAGKADKPAAPTAA